MARRGGGAPRPSGAAALIAVFLTAAPLVHAVPAGANVPVPTWTILATDISSPGFDALGPGGETHVNDGGASGPIITTPDDKYAYVGTGPTNGDIYEVANPTGPSPTLVNTLQMAPYGLQSFDLAETPDGKYVYAAGGGLMVIDNADSATSTLNPSVVDPTGGDAWVAVTPDGQYAYVVDENQDTVRVVDGADTPTPQVNPNIELFVGHDPTAIAMSPDGKYAYVLDSDINQISVIDNVETGDPTVRNVPIDLMNEPAGGSVDEPWSIAVSPDGQYAYVVEFNADCVEVVANLESSHPSVTHVVHYPGPATTVSFSPDGQEAYVDQAGGTNVVTLISNAESSNPTVTYNYPFPWPLAADLVSDEAPVAAFSATPGAAGSPTQFDASASTVAFGAVTSYSWNFGDGAGATTAGPTTSHTYASPGNYTVSVTETDQAGTSGPATTVFTGHQVLREGSSSATASHVLTVPPNGEYWLTGSDGGIFNYGGAGYFGSTGGQHLNAPVVGMAATRDGRGYWLVASDGGIFDYGDAPYLGSTGGQPLDAPIVAMAPTPDGAGYWLVAADGGIFNYGDAPYLGSMGGQHLDAPIAGLAATPDGAGYWLVAADGGIFDFGDAAFHGSMGGRHLNAPIVAMAADPATGGYWLVAADGGVFGFDAPYLGSMGGQHLDAPIVGMTTTPDGAGYWFVAADGGIFDYGDAPFSGSMGGRHLDAPIVAMAG